MNNICVLIMEYIEMVNLAEKLAKENGGFVGGSIMLCEHGVNLGREPKDIDIIILEKSKFKHDLVLPEEMCEINAKENEPYGDSVIYQGVYEGVKIDFLRPLSTLMCYSMFELDKMRLDSRWLLYASIASAISAKQSYQNLKRAANIFGKCDSKHLYDLDNIYQFTEEHDIVGRFDSIDNIIEKP